MVRPTAANDTISRPQGQLEKSRTVLSENQPPHRVRIGEPAGFEVRVPEHLPRLGGYDVLVGIAPHIHPPHAAGLRSGRRQGRIRNPGVHYPSVAIARVRDGYVAIPAGIVLAVVRISDTLVP